MEWVCGNGCQWASSKRVGVRVGLRTIFLLALAATAAGAALAHLAIDVAGDYLLPRDSYDHLRHGSRGLMTGIALAVTAMLVARGLRVCCEIAAKNRTRLVRPVLGLWETAAMVAAAVAASAAIVPAMEYFDGQLDGTPVRQLSDAFGGSIPLGLITTFLCVTFVAGLVFAVARWLISHRETVATLIETLLRRLTQSGCRNDYDLLAQRFTPRQRRAVNALRLSKRGPPANGFV